MNFLSIVIMKCAEKDSTLQFGATEMPRNTQLFPGRSQQTCNQPGILKKTEIE